MLRADRWRYSTNLFTTRTFWINVLILLYILVTFKVPFLRWAHLDDHTTEAILVLFNLVNRITITEPVHILPEKKDE